MKKLGIILGLIILALVVGQTALLTLAIAGLLSWQFWLFIPGILLARIALIAKTMHALTFKSDRR